MIKFKEFELENGLRIIYHSDKSTPIVAFNMLYDVGARDEDENKTGFAHLFEHLMFGGSVNIPNFDGPLQLVGGENNAFTSNDITNYYITLPKANIETAFWLESDRMLSLAFTDRSLEVQRQVVVEEFKQRYLNQPYGDVFLLLRPLAYKKHPYRWATIGKKLEHIENATMEDVKAFFATHYHPANAVLSIAGNVSMEKVKELSEKWFAAIPRREKKIRNLPNEDSQTEKRVLTVKRNVPQDAIYYAFHMVERNHPDYYTTDLLSDILSRGNSSRFHQNLIKKCDVFTEVNAFITGDMDRGLFIISGKLKQLSTYEEAEKLIWQELNTLTSKVVDPLELQKVKNKAIASHEFGKVSVLNKAMGLAISSLIDTPNLINTEIDRYKNVTASDVKRVASELFREKNMSVLYYKAKEKE